MMSVREYSKWVQNSNQTSPGSFANIQWKTRSWHLGLPRMAPMSQFSCLSSFRICSWRDVLVLQLVRKCLTVSGSWQVVQSPVLCFLYTFKLAFNKVQLSRNLEMMTSFFRFLLWNVEWRVGCGLISVWWLFWCVCFHIVFHSSRALILMML